jgi:ElaB/YqjD/DUF883 family membrane-anchored ribosome-binding protein
MKEDMSYTLFYMTAYEMAAQNKEAIKQLQDEYYMRLEALRSGTGPQALIERGRRFIGKNPTLVIGGALALGLIAGVFIGRRSGKRSKSA